MSKILIVAEQIDGNLKNISHELVNAANLISGEIYPYFEEAIAQSIKLFVAGCAGVLKPVRELHFLPYPQLVSHGIGEKSLRNEVYTKWLELFIANTELDEQTCKQIKDLYAQTGLAVARFESFTADEQVIINSLFAQKGHDWLAAIPENKGDLHYWWKLDAVFMAKPFDMRFILPTKLIPEINGYGAGLFVHSTCYHLYLERYGVKSPVVWEILMDDHSDNFIRVHFDTAWNPISQGIVEALSQKYRCAVTHHYVEEGMGFCGFSEYSSCAELIDESHDDLQYGPEDEDEYCEVIGPDYIVDYM